MKYEFVDVELKGGLKTGKTDAFEQCKSIIQEKSEEGWDLVQIVPVQNEKSGVGSLSHYTIIFKINPGR